MTKYVAVGFKTSTSRSIFYFKTDNLGEFIRTLMHKIELKNPDFVSLRMVKT